PRVAWRVELVQLPAAHPQVETESLSSECAPQLVHRGPNGVLRTGGRCIGPEDTRQVTAGDRPAAFAHEVRKRERRKGKREAALPDERAAALDSHTSGQIHSQLFGRSGHGSSGEFTAGSEPFNVDTRTAPEDSGGADDGQKGHLRLWQND